MPFSDTLSRVMPRFCRKKAAISLLLISLVSLLSGCISMMQAIYSDPRTQNHAYYAKVELSFVIGNYSVTATRYAEVYYLTGGHKGDRWFPECNKTKENCWGITNHFFIGLPNGDIVDIFIPLPSSPQSLAVGATTQINGDITFVQRNQPEHPVDGRTCLPLPNWDKIYNMPVEKNTMPPTYKHVHVEITRLKDGDEGDVIDPHHFYEAWIFDKEPCSYSLDDASKDRTVTILPQKN